MQQKIRICNKQIRICKDTHGGDKEARPAKTAPLARTNGHGCCVSRCWCSGWPDSWTVGRRFGMGGCGCLCVVRVLGVFGARVLFVVFCAFMSFEGWSYRYWCLVVFAFGFLVFF